MSTQSPASISTSITSPVSALSPQPISRTSSASSVNSLNSTSLSHSSSGNSTHGLPSSQQQQQQQQAQHQHPQLAPIIIPQSSSPPSSVHSTHSVASPTTSTAPASPTRARSGSVMSIGGPTTRVPGNSTAHTGHATRRSMSGAESLGILKMPPPQSETSSAPGAVATPPIGLTREGSAGMGFGTPTSGEGMLSNNAMDYEVRDPIGYGSSAVVYSAIYKPSNKRVAIKMIDLDMFERNQIDELRRETALMALSKHPNVLRVYGSFVKGSKLYIVTPYLSGGSCLDIMKNGFPKGFDEISIATILRQALEGLMYLHRGGHIHRDVKAGNLLMDEDGQVLLADFGVSSSLVENGERGVRKTFVGTPCWMAPEVMEQAGYDYKADIWSFGITGLELATGHAPFAKFPPLKVLMLTLQNDPPTLDRENTKHKYSKQFKEMVDMCLQKDPNKRPTAEKLLQHPFFRQAKKKDYLVKALLHGLPPLEQREHKRVPHRHNSVGAKNLENWDFGGEGERVNTEESISSSITADTYYDDEPEDLLEQRETQTSHSNSDSGNLGFDPPATYEPRANGAAPVKHISFGAVVVKSLPHPASPGQPQLTSSPDATNSPSAFTRRSRFVVEEPHQLTASSAISASTAPASSEPAAPSTTTTTTITTTTVLSPTPSHGVSVPPSLPITPAWSVGEPRVEQDKLVVGLGNSAKETVTSPVLAVSTQTLSAGQPEKEVRKGRFSVTEGTVHPRSTTPSLDGNTLTEGVSGALKGADDRPGLPRTLSTDNLHDRRNRLQHSAVISSQLPPPLPTSAPGPLQPAPTIPSQRIGEAIPLSREGSFSSTASLTRGDGLGGKVSRFSIESRQETHAKEGVAEGANAVLEVREKSAECKKKGRFELTGGLEGKAGDGLSHGNAHGSDSPGSSSRSGSPTTSPSSSISRGQASRLLDSSSTHFLYSHLETLLKQNETQRAVLEELFTGMRLAGLRNAREASKQLDLYPAAPPSPAHPPTIPLPQQSTATPYEAVANAGVGSQRLLTSHTDLLVNMQTIGAQVQSLVKENDLLKRDNEGLRRELDHLRKMMTGTSPPSSSIAVGLGTPNVVSGTAALPDPANAPSSAESNAQRASTISSTSQLK